MTGGDRDRDPHQSKGLSSQGPVEEQKKGEKKDWRELGEVEGWRWRKSGYRNREEVIYIKRVIIGLTRDLALEGIPGVHGDVPS